MIERNYFPLESICQLNYLSENLKHFLFLQQFKLSHPI
uniref:Uncharacterized protein n=1 Tax=Rhizophora mucronata TaxID=61149 RepID=A0A2P2N6R5_RHIMU